MDPAVHPDLVAAGFADEVDHLRMDPRAHRRDEIRHRDLVLVEERHDARQTDAGAVLVLRETADGGLAEADRDGLVIHVEREQYRDLCSVRPRFWLEALARSHRVDDGED